MPVNPATYAAMNHKGFQGNKSTKTNHHIRLQKYRPLSEEQKKQVVVFGVCALIVLILCMWAIIKEQQ